MKVELSEDLKDFLGVAGEEVARILVALFAATVLNILLILGYRSAWGLYRETDIGELFFERNPSLSGNIEWVVSQPLFEFAIQLSLTTFLFTFVVSLCMHLSYVRHYLYEPFPLYVKGIWVLGVTYFASEYVQQVITLPSEFIVAYVLVLPAVICMLPTCLKVMDHLVPDLITASVRLFEWFRDRLAR